MQNFIEAKAKVKSFPKRRVAVVGAGDIDVIEAVFDAKNEGLIEPIFIDSKEKILKANSDKFDLSGIEIIDEREKIPQCQAGIKLVKENRAEILMKGLIPTPILFKEVLNKETGLRFGKLLTHIGIIKTPNYHKMLIMTDGGIVIAPTLDDKIAILENASVVAKALEIEKPKVAVISAVETISTNMQSTVDAAILTKMYERGQLPGLIIDGPLAMDNAVSKEAAQHKGIKSEVSGDPDILLMPNIESGNIFYKTLVYLGGGADTAGIVIGAKVPLVVPSRSDSPQNKLNSIIMANLVSYSISN
ncbi:MAG TPA: bifunctional enoyl-CoA hydratase/phosphate acetyltransferase [Caldisericia bacterium]|nr:bifunctional enoyl-CoA hydratase/phosphate acetyltransferase [Caldisericia bacterium]HPO28775.1 bifunctional enoyl-CoA hydratase/phosphate acetyltransferase [Caldisericia bacterium]